MDNMDFSLMFCLGEAGFDGLLLAVLECPC